MAVGHLTVTVRVRGVRRARLALWLLGRAVRANSRIARYAVRFVSVRISVGGSSWRRVKLDLPADPARAVR